MSRPPSHRKGRATLRHDDRGLVTGVVAFLVAGVIFIASVGALLYISRTGARDPAVSDDLQSADLNSKAVGLANILLDSPGFGAGGTDWAPTNQFGEGDPNADNIGRLGLLEDSDEDRLDFPKLQNLRRAPYADDSDDGYVNYPEARRSLGLTASDLDFHIRAYPTLQTVRDILEGGGGTKDPNLRVMYIGDIVEANGGDDEDPVDPGNGLGISAITCTTHATEYPGAYRIATTLTNGGTEETLFEAVFDVELGNGDVEYHKRTTFLVPPTGTSTVYADVAALDVDEPDGRKCAGAEVTLSVYDSTNLLATRTATMVEATPAPTEALRAIVVLLDADFYTPTDPIELTYSGQNIAENDKLILTVCPGTTECRLGSDTSGTIQQISVPKKEKDREVTFAAGTYPLGEHMVRLYDNANGDAAIETGAMRGTHRLLITAAEPGPYVPPIPPPEPEPGEYTAGPAAVAEVAYLERLVEKFCPTWFDSTTGTPIADWGTWASRCSTFKAGQPHVGDVYPQLKKTLKDELSNRLMTGASCTGTARYDWTNVLVVGSNVDHNVLTSGDVKHCVEAWVLGGGTLIVFGSQDMNTHWLESVFHTALESSSGGISVPDASHPVLHVGDDLAYTDYEHDYAWRLKTTGSFDAESAFTRVANDAATNDAILAVGDPGAFQNGNVILTGWTPYDLGTANDEMEGLKLTNNLLMLGYRDLYIDYGPPLPQGVNVIPAVRTVQVEHPQFSQPLELSVILYVF